MNTLLHRPISSIGLFLVLASLIGACNKQEPALFRKVSAKHSGIHFVNTITESETFNILNFHYIYNGGGVGVGDFDNDGLPDLFFSGNQVQSVLYLNKGNLQFEALPPLVPNLENIWATGVAIVDVNADGWQDIYLSVGGLDCDGNCKNLLLIHQGVNEEGIPEFKEMAAQYGLDDGLYTQQAAFFDYDLDGDLDVYLLRNVIDKRDKNVPSEKRFINVKSKDVLLRNDGQGNFEKVSDSLGIVHRGYGLGIAIDDFNNDLLPDIYIANDFLSDDLMYLNLGKENEKHLGFKEVSKKVLKHTSYNAMGVDIADVNNDLLPDIFVLDMWPEYNERQKTMLGFMNYNKFQLSLRQGYTPQFVRNTLQLHNGFLNDEILPFSEIGYLSGLHNTDWSWTPLLADFDNDGDRDLFVTNGYGKDITDLDFINYSQQRSPFGTPESQEKELYEKIQRMDPITMPNFIFENEGGLQFQNRSGAWMPKENSISNGAVYVDLDNDGDLDIVTNNIDQPAYLLENKSTGNHYIRINLKEDISGNAAIGTKVLIWHNGKQQSHYHAPIRGYLSTVEQSVHFGLGQDQTIDSLKIFWPNGNVKAMYEIAVDQSIDITSSSSLANTNAKADIVKPVFTPIQAFNFNHEENHWQDFDVQPLLFHQHSRQGPCLVAANIDGQQGDELFVGGAKGYPARILSYIDSGYVVLQELGEVLCEDTDAAFFDADNDADLDLYVVSGGVEFTEGAPEWQDRLYLNDGTGQFFKQEMDLPKSSGGVVKPCDFDKDGDIDLFIGARVEPGNYPYIPGSSLLINEHGHLIDDTDNLAHLLSRVGMVADAEWSDVDKNGWLDLIIVGEGMPITIFMNDNGQFQKTEVAHSSGFWNTIAKADLDKDGDDDFLLGNIGNNNQFKATKDDPFYIYTKDLDGNGSPDPIAGQSYLSKDGTKRVYPLHARDDVVKQVVDIKKRFVTYAAYGEATLQDLTATDLTATDFMSIEYLSSACLINNGTNGYELIPLPVEAQLAPVQDIEIGDFDQDGEWDVLLSGNDFTKEKNYGWQDASNGLMLRGIGKGQFQVIPTSQSGFYVPLDGRDIIRLNTPGKQQMIVVGQNSGPFATFIF